MSHSTVVRESPVLSALEHLKPKWSELNGMRLVTEGGQADVELGIADVSALMKLGLKGRGAAAWLENNALPVPRDIYACNPLEGGGILIRTGTSEFFIEDGPTGQTVARLIEQLNSPPPDVYPVWRQDASMILAGKSSIEVLAQTCGYNFRDSGEIFVYSRVAGVSCGILKRIRGDVPSFQFWCDCSFGLYLWEELVQIVRELAGDVVGMNQLHFTGGSQ